MFYLLFPPDNFQLLSRVLLKRRSAWRKAREKSETGSKTGREKVGKNRGGIMAGREHWRKARDANVMSFYFFAFAAECERESRGKA